MSHGALRGTIAAHFLEDFVDTVPSDCRFTKTHEWLRVEDGLALVGITAFAVDQLGDVAYVDLPQVGTSVVREQRFGEIESVKAVEDLIAPVSGVVAEVNTGLSTNLDTLVKYPYGVGWMIKIRCTDPAEIDTLLTADAYTLYCSTLEH